MARDDDLIRAIDAAALPIDSDRDRERFLHTIAGRRFVLIGEASHGTHEFYRLRAELTQTLIEEHGFHAVAVEGDWPDAYRVNRYVRGRDGDDAAVEALDGFRRFPPWMWRNADVLEFISWLRDHNDDRAAGARAGFYGLDLYCLYESIDAVLGDLDRVDPAAAARARERYGCFDHVDDAEAYGAATHYGRAEDCRSEVIEQLIELRRRGLPDDPDEDERFFAEQNARVVASAEHYYREMFARRVSSWNIRDQHMANTLDALAAHLTDQHGEPSRIVVWAHNSHVGDARATEMGDEGELTLGQLVRQRHPDQVALIGMTTYHGTVTCATNWGEPSQRKMVRDGLDGSVEDLLHRTGRPHFALDLRALGPALRGLEQRRLHRAIGVIYRPETERGSHYFHVVLPRQYDLVIHFDRTHAVEPLERRARVTAEAPETYPTGL